MVEVVGTFGDGGVSVPAYIHPAPDRVTAAIQAGDLSDPNSMGRVAAGQIGSTPDL